MQACLEAIVQRLQDTAPSTRLVFDVILGEDLLETRNVEIRWVCCNFVGCVPRISSLEMKEIDDKSTILCAYRASRILDLLDEIGRAHV